MKLRFKRWLKRITIALTVVLVMLGYATVVSLWLMSRADARHAEYYHTGADVNSFLKAYSTALLAAHESGDTSPLMNFYAEEYASPKRGAWRFVDDPNRHNAQIAHLEPKADEPFDLPRLQQELSSYLNQIASIERVKCKIDLIETYVPKDHLILTVKYILDGHDNRGMSFEA